MKRFLIISVVVVVAAGVFVPYLIGAKIEKLFRDQMTMIENQLVMPPEIKVSLDRFESGYLSSKAVTSLVIDTRAMQNQQGGSPVPQLIKITMSHAIQHGPVIFSSPDIFSLAKIVSQLEMTGKFAELELFYFGEEPAILMTTYLDFGGASTVNMRVPPYEGPSYEGEFEISWQGMTINTVGHWLEMSAKSDMSAPLLEIANENFKFVMSGARAEGESHMSPLGFGLGGGTMTVADMSVSGGGVSASGEQHALNLDKLRLHVDVKQTDNLVSVVEELGFDRLKVDENAFDHGVLRVELKNFDAVTVQTAQQKIQSKFKSLSANADPAAAQKASLAVIQEVLSDLLRHSPEFLISKAEVQLAEGLANGRVRIAIQNGDQFDMQKGLPTIIPLLIIEVDLRAPVKTINQMAQSIVRKQISAQLAKNKQPMTDEELEQRTQHFAEQMLMQGMQQNFIKRDENNYSLTLRLTDGNLFLNGLTADGLMAKLTGMNPK